MQTRKFVVRHLSRDKKHEADPQRPKLIGFIETFIMGLILAMKHKVESFSRIVSSPQPRGTRTASILQIAISLFHSKGDGLKQLVQIETDNGLNDFSSDERFRPLKKAFKAVKDMGGAIESEQAIFQAGDESELGKLRLTKLNEAIATIDGIEGTGDILIGGIHGCTVDGLYSHYARRLNEDTPNGMDAFGRMMDKVEGFALVYEDGVLKSIEKVTRPAWLNALSPLIG